MDNVDPNNPFYKGQRDVQDLEPTDLPAMQAFMRNAQAIGGEYMDGVYEGLLDISVANIRAFMKDLPVEQRGHFMIMVGQVMMHF